MFGEEKDAPLVLFDMDDTLFDFSGTLRADFKRLMSPDEEEPEDLWDETNGYIKARIDLIKSQPGWWRNLPKYQPGWEIYSLAKQLGFHSHILTKGPASRPYVWMEKVECIQHHFGSEVSLDIVGVTKEHRFGHVLVDDYKDYVEGWLKWRKRGLVIMPAHKHNEGFKHENVIRYTGENLDEICRALIAVQNRKPGESWQQHFFAPERKSA